MKRVKTKVLRVNAVSVATANTELRYDYFVPQEDIVIIGWYLENGWAMDALGGSPNPGHSLAVDSTLTQAAEEWRDGQIARVTNEPATVENAVNAAEGGVINERCFVEQMLPEGFGIPVKDGDTINLIHYFRNDSGAGCGANSLCCIYYIDGKATG